MRYLLMICTDEAAIQALRQEEESVLLAEKHTGSNLDIERR
jgi:hypothetical protein